MRRVLPCAAALALLHCGGAETQRDAVTPAQLDAAELDPAGRRSAKAAPSAAVQRLEARLREPRAKLAKNAGDSRSAVAFGVRVQTAILTGAFRADPSAQERLVQEAAGYLRSAAKRQTEDRSTLLAVLGELWLVHGAVPEAKQALEDSLAAKPNLLALTALLPLYSRRQNYDEVKRRCQEARPSFQDPEELYGLMTLCIENAGTRAGEPALAWASDEDRDWYQREQAKRQPPAQPLPVQPSPEPQP